jgi:hypothetical protein
MHPQAHLWDNNARAASELTSVMKIRQKALEQFGENNIRKDMPLAMLEEVLVPIYFFHRYQLEATSKIIGGMYYTYALRGDGQVVTKSVPKAEQVSALNAIIEAIDPDNLLLPAKILQVIPPRPAGYNFSRELFNKRTGFAFDALAPAESVTDFIFSFVFHPERMNRMMQYKHLYNGLGADEMITSLINSTWKAPRQTGIKKLIQLQNEQVLLTYLLSTSIDENVSYTTRSVIQHTLSNLKAYIEKQKNGSNDATYSGHLLLALERIKAPEKAKATVHKIMPPGAPIGCDLEY